MQPILRDFLDKWVYPTGFSGAGVEFRLRQTERCLPLWDRLVAQAIQFAQKDLKSGSDEYKAVRARRLRCGMPVHVAQTNVNPDSFGPDQ
jgi:hypothetical protein